MMRIATVSTWIALALLPFVVAMVGRRFELVYLAGLVAVPLGLFLAVGHWPGRRVLRWGALVLNGLVALVTVPAFAYMIAKVPAPPSVVAVLPVLMVAQVLAIAPVTNVVALLAGWRRRATAPAAA